MSLAQYNVEQKVHIHVSISPLQAKLICAFRNQDTIILEHIEIRRSHRGVLIILFLVTGAD